MTYEFKVADLTDTLDLIDDLGEQYHNYSDLREFLTFSEFNTLEYILSNIMVHGRQIYICRHDGAIVGAMVLQIENHFFEENICKIDFFYVSKGHDISSLFINYAHEFAKYYECAIIIASGMANIKDTVKDRAWKRLFKRNEFKEFGGNLIKEI